MSRNKSVPAAPAPDRVAELQITADTLNEAIAAEAASIAYRVARQIDYDRASNAFNTYVEVIKAATVIKFHG